MVGLRLAEVAGLCVESFDFENNTIYVDKTLQFGIEIRALHQNMCLTKSRIQSILHCTRVKSFLYSVAGYA